MSQQILPIELPTGFTFDMVLVEGGAFMMGSDEEEAFEDEKPVHNVTLTDFYIGKYLVTQALWEAVMGMGNNPSNFQGDKLPVESVSWNDTKYFIQLLNKQTGKIFRLPTEAEWEYAARGGKHSLGYRFSGSDKLKQVGWFTENSGEQTREVGMLLANELGLHDMSGNVWEWCEDDWHDSYKGAPADGTAWVDRPERGAYRVIRGGSCFFGGSRGCRPSRRLNGAPTGRGNSVGIRLVLPSQ